MPDLELKIVEAIKNGEADQVKQYMAEKPELVHIHTSQGISLLMLSLYYGRPEIADLLVQSGLQLNVFDAAAFGNLEILAKLVSQDADLVDAYSSDGFQPLGLACFFGKVEIAEFLVKHRAQVNSLSHNPQKVAPLHSAAAADSVEIAELLLDNGSDVNQPQKDGFTPLHAAAQNGNLEMVKLFINYGAVVNAVTAEGKTPLDLARDYSRKEVSDYLQEIRG